MLDINATKMFLSVNRAVMEGNETIVKTKVDLRLVCVPKRFVAATVIRTGRAALFFNDYLRNARYKHARGKLESNIFFLFCRNAIVAYITDGYATFRR